MEVIYELISNQIEQLHRLFQCEWWTKDRTLEDTKKCVEGSQVCVGIIDQKGVLQGFSRVITDFTFKAFIFDAIVSEQYRGSGLGNQLVSLIKNHEDLVSVKHFKLYCLPELQGFYEQYGFSAEVGGIQLMRHVAGPEHR